MVNPSDIGEAVGSIFDNQILSMVIKYGGYTVISAIMLAVIVAVYFLVQYKYKVTYPILYYDPEKQTARVIGYKHDRARDQVKNGVRKQILLWKRKKIEPFREADIQVGNKVNILKINEDGTYVSMPPLKFNGELSHFEQLSPEEKYWAVLQLQENAKTFASEDAQKRAMMLTMFTVIFCLVMVGITVYLSLKAPTQVVDSFNTWGMQFNQIAASIGGTPPG